MNIFENFRKSGIYMFLEACLSFCARISGIMNAKLFPNFITILFLCLMQVSKVAISVNHVIV